MINDYIREPHSGKKPEYVVVYFHGYSSSGSLMEQYAGDLLGPLLPEARLRFADAPVQMGWDNHSWFELRDIVNQDLRDDVLHDIVSERAAKTAKEVNEYIDRVMKEEGFSEDRIILAGFSQGGTMAFYTGMMRDKPVAGVFSLSGGALDHVPDIRSKPPVMLAAGAQEQQDYSGEPHAKKTCAFLKAQKISAECRILPDQEHKITLKSMELLRDFARKMVSKSPAPQQDHYTPPSQPSRPDGPRI